MKKNILFIVLGIFVAVLLVSALEFVAGQIFPHPEGMDYNNPEEVKKMMMSMPAGAFIFMALSWGIATFAGGFIAGLRSESFPLRNALIVGGIILILTLINLISLPHSLWFSVLSLSVLLPAAYLGGKIGMNFRKV